jgi:hypothetical protein
MKRIAKALVILTLASAATVASAQTALNQYGNPISGDYPYPASVDNGYSLASEFPNMTTYKQEHKNDPVPPSQTAASPYSVPSSASMADDGLVPGIAGVPPYDNGGTHG